MRFATHILSLVLLTAMACAAALADPPATPPTPPPAAVDDRAGAEFFERHVRPVLVEQCYGCHSARAEKVKGKLWLDSRQGIDRGGENGAVLVPGNPDASRLIEAVRWADPDLQMPPKQKLTAQQIEQLEQWVKMGAPTPREDAGGGAAPVATRGAIDVEAGRSWWAFQPVTEGAAPRTARADWAKRKIDPFILAELEAKRLDPSPEADRRTLVRRAYLDLTGLHPTYDEVEAFAHDDAPDAYERLVERLLASPRYGERWGRYWLDVARYGEDNPTTEASNPGYRFAWRYRDWVIDALNRDVPYDRFVKLQLAADLMPGTDRADFAALGFLGLGLVYHKDARLSKDVTETFYTDEWDERVDTVSRGLLGLSVACARCHDHKFDPIGTRDYYGLAGVFASTVAAPRPTRDVDAATETRFMAASQRVFFLSYAANLMRTEPGSKPREARAKVGSYLAEMDRIMAEMAFLRDGHPEMYAYLQQLARRPAPFPGEAPRPTAAAAEAVAAAATSGGGGGGAATQPAGAAVAAGRGRGRGGGGTEPFVNAVFDAGLWVDGSDPDFTMNVVRPGVPRDLNVLPGGNVSKPGEVVPRKFIAVLSKGDGAFRDGSGRRELGERIFSDAAPLAARVIVNRAWALHFGRPLVATPSDFGAQGERPTHPRLLDDLSARFIASGWSLKWLHREIMLSAAYRQASRPRAEGVAADPGNRLVWRMNPRRLDVEAYRDGILQAAGTLDLKTSGPSVDADQTSNARRTVYSRIGRGRVSTLLQLYDFPEPTMHSPGRETTTTPLQQLFVMNSPFMQEQAAAMARAAGNESTPEGQVRALYRAALARDARADEVALGTEYLKHGTVEQYAQALLCTNEVIFWP